MNRYFHAFLFLCAFYGPACLQAQVISTIAGNGTMGFTGDGGPAVLAEIYLPNGIAIDSAGNVYVSTSDERVRKISTAGIITTVAGNGTGLYAGDGVPATATGIPGINDIKFDRNWNLYLASLARIVKVNTAGIVTTVAGNGTAGFSGDGGPATAANIEGNGRFAIDTAGNIYISDGITNRIRKVNTAGIITTIAGTGVAGFSGDGGQATAAQLYIPEAGFVDRHGNLYFVDYYNYRVRKIDATGIITTIAGTGVPGYSGDGGPASAAQIAESQSLSADSAGNIYVTDGVANNCVRKILPSGIISTIVGGPSYFGFGGDGGPATAALVFRPICTARYDDGSIYIADRQNNRIRMISAAPYFLHGKYQAATVCSGFVFSLDTLLAASDSNAGLTQHWSLISGPHHGTASVTYTATSTGSAVYPVGLTYTPTTGYTGLDTFMVRITDSIVSDTTIIYATVVTPPVLGAITGFDTVCMRDSIMLSDSTAGGTWRASNAHAIVAAGVVQGVTAGADTILYTVYNICGWQALSHVVTVKECPSSVSTPYVPESGIQLYPNPTTGTFNFILTSTYNEDTHIIITNPIGEKVKEITTATNHPKEIMLNAPTGIYFLNALTTHGAWSEKIIVLSKQ